METTAICVVNGATIQVSNDEQQLVPIKPICQALGIDDRAQRQKISEDEVLSSTGVLSTLVGADGKQREMFCLPLKFIYGWLFTINPKNVSEEARPAVMRYRIECYNALYDHFTRGMKRQHELLEAENEYLKQLDEARTLLAEHKDGVAKAKNSIAEIEQKLVAIREERHNPTPTLFD